MPAAPGYVRGPLVIPQTAQMRMVWQLANGTASNVLHAIVADGFHWTTTDVDNVMDGIVASTGWTDIHPLLATTTLLLGLEIKDIRAPHLGSIASSAPAAAGTDVNRPFPDQIALVVTLLTDGSGRSNRGRTYVPGWANDAGDASGLATVDAVLAAEVFMSAVRDAMAAVGFEMAIGHRGHAAYISPATGIEVPAELAGSVPVSSVRVRDNKFDTQRRRQ